MRLVMRVLVLIALPGLVFSWMPGAVRTAFLRECGAPELLLTSRPRPFGDCTLSVLDAGRTAYGGSSRPPNAAAGAAQRGDLPRVVAQ